MATPRQYQLTGATLADRYDVGRSRPGRVGVYDGYDRQTGALVTIAIESGFPVVDAAAFARLAALDHPHVARLLAVGAEPHFRYVVGELVDGFFLDEELAAGPIGAARIAAIMAAVTDGVAALHAHGLWHGEVDTRAVYVGRPASASDTEVSAVKLTSTQLAFERPAGARDADACRALHDVLCADRPIGPTAAPPMMTLPMPTNWSPPPPARTFAHGTK
jgi:hypothetical protein